MITKVLQSNDLRATLEYVYQESKSPEVVDTTCMDASREGALEDIREYISQRPEIKKPVFHAVLSLSEEEYIDKNTWQKVAEEYTQKMGYGDVPYVAVRHQDTAHHHIHIVASRVQLDGELISDSFEAYRSQEVARAIERAHNLTPVPSSWEVDQRRARPEELHKTVRLNETNQREFMQRTIAESLKHSRNTEQFVQALHQHQVRVIPNVTQDEKKVQGISFERDGVKLAGSKINRQYSWNQLKHRLDFTHQRDLETLRRTPESSPPQQPKAPSQGTSTHVVHPSPEEFRRTQVHRTSSPPSSHHTPQTSSTIPTPAHASHTHVPEASSPHQDASTRIRQALERAPEHQGWKSWSDALKRDGVEAVPKVTQQDERRIRGMYFVSGDAMIPGSQVDRRYSVNHLEQRLGALTHESKHAQIFESVMVPGEGLRARTPEPVQALSSYEQALSAFKKEGTPIELHPSTFDGSWERTVQDAHGTQYGVLGHSLATSSHTSAPSRIALVKLEPSTSYVKAYRHEGQLIPHQRLTSHTHLSQGTPVMWRNDGTRQTLIQITSAPHREEPSQSHEPPRIDEASLVTQLQQGGYQVTRQPSFYEGRLGRVIPAPDGKTYGVLVPSDTQNSKHVALITITSDTQLVSGVKTSSSLKPVHRLESIASFQQGDAIVWRSEKSKSALIRVTNPTQERDMASSSPQKPSHNTCPSYDTWAKKMKEEGKEMHPLTSGRAMSGKLWSAPVTLQEGDFHVLETRQNKLLLIPKQDDHDALQGQRVMAKMRQDGRIALTSLERNKDRGMSR